MKRKIITTLLAACAACTLMVGVTACEDPHEHSYVNNVATEAYLATPATCTEKATYYLSCECGEKTTETFEYGEALGHDFVTYVSDNNAVCGTDGTKTASCSRGCGETDTITDVGTALSHQYTNYVSDGNARCGVDGTKTAVCDHGCGETDTIDDVGSALTHTYTNYVSDGNARCGVDGTETAECDHGCGTPHTRTEVGSALTHTYTNYVSDGNATCLVDGTKTAECDHGCGETDTVDDVGSALGHSFTQYESNNDATCLEDGTKTAECDHGCGETDTVDDVGSALGHSYTQYESNNDATCLEDGTETAACDNGCGTPHTRTEVGSALGHSYTQYVSNNDATCLEDGTKTATCDNGCGESDTIADEGSVKGHSFTDYVYNEDHACEKDGTETAICDNGCGETDTKTKEGTALEHVYTNYVPNGDALCEQDGTKTAECDHGCGETDTVADEGSALGHSFTEYVPNGDALCEEDGTKTANCDNGCGKTDTIADEGSALGHTYTNYVPDGNALCEQDGTKTATCDNGCGKTDTVADEGSALGHTYGEWVSLGDGSYKKVCANDESHEVMADVTAIETEYLYSASNAEVFNADNQVINLAEVIGTEDAIDEAYIITDEGDVALDVADGKIAFPTTKELTSYQVVIFAGDKIVKVSLKVATLVIDEAEDYKFFTYTGSYVATEGSNAIANQKGVATAIYNGTDDVNELLWDGYYLLVKDIDASTASYGSATAPHAIGADAGVIVATKGSSAKYLEESTPGLGFWQDYFNPWVVNAYENGPYPTLQVRRGFVGTFEGNGHVIRNFVSNADGIFGVIQNATIKNLALLNSSKLGKVALDSTFDNLYVSKTTAESTIVTAADVDTVISNSLIEYSNVSPLGFNGGIIPTYDSVVNNSITNTTDLPATFVNTIIVTATPIKIAYTGYAYAWGGLQYEASLVDGVAPATTNTKQYKTGNYTDDQRTSTEYTTTLIEGLTRYTSIAKMTEAYALNDQLFSGFTSNVWEVVEGQIVFASLVEEYFGIVIEQEYLYSAADGVFFDEAGNVVALADIIGEDQAVLTAGTDKDGNEIVVDGAIINVPSSKDGLVDNVLTLIINGTKYKIYVKVATLIIDEAEDFKYFQYKGEFTGEGLTAGSNEMISGFAKQAFNERALSWSGYYMLVKDIDASTATFGNSDNPYYLSGSASIGNIVKATSVRWADANNKGNWDGNYYLYSPYYASTYMAGFKGVLDGNGHTVSNFNIYTDASNNGVTDGLFGQILGGTIKNLGWVNSGSLAVLARETVIDNCYFYMDTHKPIVGSADTATVLSNSVVINNSSLAVYKGIFGVHNVDEHNITTNYGTMATFDNVIIVSSIAINHGYNSQSNYSFGAIRFDAATVDGVESTGTSNIVYTNDANYDNRTVTNAYTYGIQAGAARYTSVDKMVEIYNADNTIYDAFTSNLWSVVDGVLTFGA